MGATHRGGPAARPQSHYAGRAPNIPMVIMLKITFMQRWFGLSDPALEEAIFDRGLGTDGGWCSGAG